MQGYHSTSLERDPMEADARGIQQKMITCRIRLTQWSNEHFGNNARKLTELKHQLRRNAVPNKNQAEVEEERRLEAQIKETWRRKEIFWKQRSRVKCLVDGDQNTTFFHLTTSSRKWRNHICRLKGRDRR